MDTRPGVSADATHLPSWHVFGVFIELVNVSGERLKVWNDKLLPEGLGQQDDVALDTSKTGGGDTDVGPQRAFKP